MAVAMSSARSRPANGLSPRVNMLLIGLFHAFAPLVKALPMPFGGSVHALADEDLPKSPDDASLWLYLGIAIALVLAGGIFAGLTIACVYHGTPFVPPCADVAVQVDGPG